MTAISEDLRRDTPDPLGVRNEIRVDPQFVNCDTLTNRIRNAAALREFAPAGEKLLIHLSNFRPVKRVLYLVSGSSAKFGRRASVRLLMVADRPERGPAEHLATTLGVRRPRPDFLGKQNQVERLIPVGARPADAERRWNHSAWPRWKPWRVECRP